MGGSRTGARGWNLSKEGSGKVSGQEQPTRDALSAPPGNQPFQPIAATFSSRRPALTPSFSRHCFLAWSPDSGCRVSAPTRPLQALQAQAGPGNSGPRVYIAFMCLWAAAGPPRLSVLLACLLHRSLVSEPSGRPGSLCSLQAPIRSSPR